jgi:protein TonB
MIKYARRKPKKDFFILWLGISTMCFGIAGVTLQGVSAVRSVPILVDSDPVAIPVSIVTIPDGIGGGSEVDHFVEPPLVAAAAPAAPEVAQLPGPLDLPKSEPFDFPDPLNLPEPKPLLDQVPTTTDEIDPTELGARELPEPDPVIEESTPPEPEPENAKPMEEPKAAPEPKPEVKKKVESKPPPTQKATKPTPKKKATPPKPAPRPAPRATPAQRDPKVVMQKPKVLYRPNLRFPDEAKRRGIGGSLLLDVKVGTNGRVSTIKIARSSGHRLLDNEAVAAVRAWRFEPAKNVFGKAISNTIRVPVNFGYAR